MGGLYHGAQQHPKASFGRGARRFYDNFNIFYIFV
jgi:hypothetical protein